MVKVEKLPYYFPPRQPVFMRGRGIKGFAQRFDENHRYVFIGSGRDLLFIEKRSTMDVAC